MHQLYSRESCLAEFLFERVRLQTSGSPRTDPTISEQAMKSLFLPALLLHRSSSYRDRC